MQRLMMMVVMTQHFIPRSASKGQACSIPNFLVTFPAFPDLPSHKRISDNESHSTTPPLLTSLWGVAL
ncbi:hypothetical protein E2C01_036817 [Portunus trituberculatus]|uniref:Uncharacterized protein n=1 Tax=Portunus trituberculatus TaxID=210409 RepID=A0A5B7FC90_PORTR|nr:hypothetical protein [Portunus trituberculatus]